MYLSKQQQKLSDALMPFVAYVSEGTRFIVDQLIDDYWQPKPLDVPEPDWSTWDLLTGIQKVTFAVGTTWRSSGLYQYKIMEQDPYYLLAEDVTPESRTYGERTTFWSQHLEQLRLVEIPEGV